MENIIYYSSLFDYYKSLLTEIQQKYFEEYYFHNYSLQEIADNFEVSKNAVSKTLIEVTNKLDYYENKLCLFHNKEKIKDTLKDNLEILNLIEDYI